MLAKFNHYNHYFQGSPGVNGFPGPRGNEGSRVSFLNKGIIPDNTMRFHVLHEHSTAMLVDSKFIKLICNKTQPLSWYIVPIILKI